MRSVEEYRNAAEGCQVGAFRFSGNDRLSAYTDQSRHQGECTELAESVLVGNFQFSWAQSWTFDYGLGSFLCVKATPVRVPPSITSQRLSRGIVW
jgi:hypothetical protein